MGEVSERHRPLRGGIRIINVVNKEGTLGAIARRDSDQAKVLVTNLHIITDSVNN